MEEARELSAWRNLAFLEEKGRVRGLGEKDKVLGRRELELGSVRWRGGCEVLAEKAIVEDDRQQEHYLKGFCVGFTR